MIQLTGVSKHYLGQNKVLERVELKLDRGDFLYVVGGSGAGKSSLLRLLATEEAPTQGKIEFFGYALDRVSSSTLRSIRQSIGYIPQSLQLIRDLSVLDNVELSLDLGPRRSKDVASRAKMGELLERLGLGPKRHELVGRLSGGEAQRVAVARALVRSPEIIVADEPTGAQDLEFTWAMMDLFVKANLGGAAVILATHDREIVKRIRKKTAVLKQGQLRMETSL
jgi:cell division transport system ATP-binding protein